ncbi:beta-lactamase [Clostridiales bacterium PH28_bin88]|nr:beta-lactamase [Clostridiales bacterium PH28_bin88]
MVEDILPNLYKIEVPLPKNPLKALNSYVIKTGERNLIIDTGMHREECINAINAGLSELDVDLGATDFFITHMHADHSGLVSYLATSTSTVFCGQPDADFVNYGGNWEKSARFARLSGFPEAEIQEAIEKHPGYKYSSKGRLDFINPYEGETIEIGDYRFTCVKTPGHTQGHICLYEENKQILLAGDHLLGDITPNISSWDDEANPLQQYLQSLDKVYQLDVKLVLPGHRRVFNNHRERIEELKHHHEVRANEVIAILARGNQDAYQVASQMTWDMTYDNWDLFPVSQKWFATGEAIAHLRYLEEKGRIQQRMISNKILYSLN